MARGATNEIEGEEPIRLLDAWNRHIVGWYIGKRMTTELVLTSSNRVLAQRKRHEVIHHSGQGSQCTSVAIGKRCAEMGVRPSTGSIDNAYDNAMVRSFFATLEHELIERGVFNPE